MWYHFFNKESILFPEKRQSNPFSCREDGVCLSLACLVSFVVWRFIGLFKINFCFPNFLNFSLLNSSVWNGMGQRRF